MKAESRGIGDAPLTQRQALVLRAAISAYVGSASPVGSKTLTERLPVSLSPASVRTTLHELDEGGYLEQPHRSAGRVPTEEGLRIYVDALLDPHAVGRYEQRDLAVSVEALDPEALVHTASRLLSERTHQLGFVVVPRLGRTPLRYLSLVRLSSERVLAILVSEAGTCHRRILEHPGRRDQAALDRMAAVLNERVVGRTLEEARARLSAELEALRSDADRLLAAAVRLGARAVESAGDDGDLVIATRLALLSQPEFQEDPNRLASLCHAIETKAELVSVLDKVLSSSGVSVTFGAEVDSPALHRCALVAAPYGRGSAPLGALGVIGPNRMDYARVIPLVGYLSQLVTENLGE